MEGLYVHNTGMYARKKVVMAMASDIVLSTDWFYVWQAENRHSNASFNDSGGGVEVPYTDSKKRKAVGFFPNRKH
jgi:hypothetical protein